MDNPMFGYVVTTRASTYVIKKQFTLLPNVAVDIPFLLVACRSKDALLDTSGRLRSECYASVDSCTPALIHESMDDDDGRTLFSELALMNRQLHTCVA